MTTVVADDFNRANGALANPPWLPFTTDGGLTISSSKALNGSAAHKGNFRSESFDDDQYGEVEVTTDPAAGDFYGPVVRCQNNGDDFYTVFYFNNAGLQLWLYKRTNGTFSPGDGGFLTDGDQTLATDLSPGDKIRISARGSVIRVYVNGVQVMKALDYDHPLGGSPGIFAWGGTPLDNFVGGDDLAHVFSDDFNRSDRNLYEHSDWATSGPAHGTDVLIASNMVHGTGSGSWNRALWQGGTCGADQFSQIEVGTVPSGKILAATVRANDAGGDNAYMAFCFNNGGTAEVRLYKIVAGAGTQLGSSYLVPGGSFVAGDVVRCEAQGSTIRAKFNGATVVTVTDTTYPSGGYPGIAFFGDTVTGDNWQGGELVTGPPNIATIGGVAVASLATIDGVAVGSLSKVAGV